MRRYLLLLLIGLLASCPIFAQKEEFKFKYLTVDQGLTSNRILCIFRDSKQFVWIGTDMGLNKFNGYKITKYLHDDTEKSSLSSNVLRCINEDPDGNVWIGTKDGLNIYDPAKDFFISYKHDPTNANSISSNDINSMLVDKKGNFWVMAGGNYLNRWDPEQKHFIRYRFKEEDKEFHDATQSIAEDSQGNIWVVSIGKNLYCFKNENNNFILKEDSLVDFGDKTIKNIYIDEQDIIWICSNGKGFYSFDPSTRNLEHFYKRSDGKGPNNTMLRWITPENDRYLLIGSDQGGINRFDKFTKTFEYITFSTGNKKSLNNNAVWTMHKDKEGILWIGTGNGGVNYYNPKEYKFKLFQSSNDTLRSPSFNVIGGFYEDEQGMIWIATDGSGVNVYNPKTGIFKVYKHNAKDKTSISGNVIRNFDQDNDKNMWFGTWNAGLNKFDRKTGKFKRFLPDENNPFSISGPKVWHIKKDLKGMIWLAIMDEGIDILDKDKGVIKRYKPEPDNPEALGAKIIWQFVEEGENMWICSWNGIYFYERAKDKFKSFKNFPDNDIRTIFIDSQGNYWAGSANKGMFLFDKKGNVIKTYNEKNGLASNQVHTITEDSQGYLWISTNFGISCFDPEMEKFRNYFASDGLQGNQFFILSYLQTRGGEIYYGGYNGFNVFHPDDLKKTNSIVPPLYLTDFEIFNKAVPYGQPGSILKRHISQEKEITIPWHQSMFSFGFTAVSYTFPEKNLYAYQLEGFDKDWNNVGTSKSATYTNLDPGKYLFKVKASNNDGIWNEHGTSIKVIITPPYWRTWWFRSLTILTLIGGLFFLYSIKLNVVKRQKNELEKQVKERTQEIEVQGEKLQILYSEVKDSIRAAEVIQKSILPSESLIKKHLPETFILYRPKDVVSGDFYWFDEKDGKIIVAAVDCTGHGVSGAFMSINAYHLINQAIHPYENLIASEILDRLSDGIIKELHQNESLRVRDGLDIALCILNKEKTKLQYAGANNPLYIE